MSRHEIDWDYLRQGLFSAALLTLACAIAWGATTVYRSRATATLVTEEQTRSNLEAERNELTERRDARRKFARTFQELSVSGVVGDEQRLALIQETRAASQELRLPYLRYTTGPCLVMLLAAPPAPKIATRAFLRSPNLCFSGVIKPKTSVL